MDQTTIRIGSSLRKGILDFLRQAEAMVGMGEGQLKLAQESEGEAREASRGGLVGRIPKPMHLFNATRQHLTRFGEV